MTAIERALEEIRPTISEPGLAGVLVMDDQADLAEAGAVLAAVSAWLTTHIQFATDRELFGVKQRVLSVEETLQVGKGDCEDYAWCAWTLAVQLGLNPDDLSIQMCVLNETESHAVLMWRDGQIVLDNQTSYLRPLDRRPDLSGIRKLAIGSFPQHAGDPDAGLRLA